ncbi:MAG: nitrile hydratase subunit alpha [Gammaproteobacteria bacterium]|nr:nitrile hydratase subunit alpha [Gammaproteobacteria bacterium]
MDIQDTGRPSPTAGRYPADEAELTARAQALEAILVDQGLLGTDTIDEIVRIYEQDIGPLLGARVVARAWVDPQFRARLLADATAACAELGIAGLQGEHLICVENTPQLHNVMVCTLCSCYPWPVLGLPPAFYKSFEYRSRMVVEPRRVLADDFGLVLPADVEIRVYDVTAEERYFVLPQRPPGTEHLDEQALAALVTRDAMIGVAKIAAP